MASRPARKRVHYVRAVYNEGAAPSESLESLLRATLKANPTVEQTAVPIASHGILQIRCRRAKTGPLMLAIGAGNPGELMSTMGVGVGEEADTEQAEAPPNSRAFKIADAFCLISGNEIVACVDGMRLSTLRLYLSLLLAETHDDASVSAFDLDPVHNLDQQAILEEEGVRELELEGTMLAANYRLTRESSAATSTWKKVADGLRNILAREAESPQEEQELAAQLGNLTVRVVVHAQGGMRAAPIVHELLAKAGSTVFGEEIPEGQLTVVTTQGTKISADQLILARYANLNRRESANDLSHVDVWAALEDYQAELVEKGHWES